MAKCDVLQWGCLKCTLDFLIKWLFLTKWLPHFFTPHWVFHMLCVSRRKLGVRCRWFKMASMPAHLKSLWGWLVLLKVARFGSTVLLPDCSCHWVLCMCLVFTESPWIGVAAYGTERVRGLCVPSFLHSFILCVRRLYFTCVGLPS